MEGRPRDIGTRQLQHNYERHLNAGVKQIEEEILAIDVIDVALVRVGPADRPRVNNGERVATVLKLWLAPNGGYVIDNKRVLASEMGAEFVIGNATAALVGPALRLLVLLLSLLSGFGIILFRRLVFGLPRFVFILILFLRFGLILARRLRIILSRLGRLRARFVLRFGVVVLVLRIKQSRGAE